MKLYYNPKSRATIARWMLDECGADYTLELVDLEALEHKAPGFLAINPAGKLPALVDGEARVFETVAICLYLADRFPQARLAPPPSSPLRGRYLSLMVYATSQLEPALADSLMHIPTHPARGWTDFATVEQVLERELGAGPYLFGEWFTAADVMVGSMLSWRRRFGSATTPALEAYLDRVLARPAAAPVRG